MRHLCDHLDMEIGDGADGVHVTCSYSWRMKATRAAFSCGVSCTPSTRLKNSTVSSSVKRRPSCIYGGESLIPRRETPRDCATRCPGSSRSRLLRVTSVAGVLSKPDFLDRGVAVEGRKRRPRTW